MLSHRQNSHESSSWKQTGRREAGRRERVNNFKNVPVQGHKQKNTYPCLDAKPDRQARDESLAFFFF
jgi:predicted nucleotide-binding protein